MKRVRELCDRSPIGESGKSTLRRREFASRVFTPPRMCRYIDRATINDQRDRSDDRKPAAARQLRRTLLRFCSCFARSGRGVEGIFIGNESASLGGILERNTDDDRTIAGSPKEFNALARPSSSRREEGEKKMASALQSPFTPAHLVRPDERNRILLNNHF